MAPNRSEPTTPEKAASSAQQGWPSQSARAACAPQPPPCCTADVTTFGDEGAELRGFDTLLQGALRRGVAREGVAPPALCWDLLVGEPHANSFSSLHGGCSAGVGGVVGVVGVRGVLGVLGVLDVISLVARHCTGWRRCKARGRSALAAGGLG